MIIRYMQSPVVDINYEANWVIAEMLNLGCEDDIKKLIHKENCVECCIDVLNKNKDEKLIYNMILALTRCIDVEEELKEVYLNKGLKFVLENHLLVNPEDNIYNKLLLKITG